MKSTKGNAPVPPTKAHECKRENNFKKLFSTV